MTDKTRQEILDGLYALVARAEHARDQADAPISGGPSGDTTPPDFPDARPGRIAMDAANAPVPPQSVRFQGL